MADFDEIKQLVLEFAAKVQQLKDKKAGNYSAKLELPEWRDDASNFIQEVSGTVAKYRVHLGLLESNRLVTADDNKTALSKISQDMTNILNFYTKQWGQQHDKEFCEKLGKSLQDTTRQIASYVNTNRPRP